MLVRNPWLPLPELAQYDKDPTGPVTDELRMLIRSTVRRAATGCCYKRVTRDLHGGRKREVIGINRVRMSQEKGTSTDLPDACFVFPVVSGGCPLQVT